MVNRKECKIVIISYIFTEGKACATTRAGFFIRCAVSRGVYFDTHFETCLDPRPMKVTVKKIPSVVYTRSMPSYDVPRELMFCRRDS